MMIGLMKQNEIAKASGHSPQTISYIINGDRHPSMQMAEALEEATGICREGWMYPSRHWNPYIPFKGNAFCVQCRNRVGRIRKSIEVMLVDFKVHRDFTRISQISITYTGQIGLLFVWRELTPEGLSLLGHAGEPPIPVVDMQTEEVTPEKIKWAREGTNTLSVPHFPYGLPDNWMREMRVLWDNQIKSLLSIMRSGLNLTLLSFDEPMNWTPEALKASEDFVQEIADIHNSIL